MENISGTKALTDHKLTKYPQLQEEYDKIRVTERLITNDVLRIVEQNGSKLNGLEYSAKSASSVEDKLERMQNKSYIKPEKGIKSLNDLVRYTQICEHKNIFPVAQNTIKQLQQEGYVLSNVNNYYIHNFPNTGYKGLHMNFISPQGQVIEMQIHSEESFNIKQQGHELYEKIRAVSTPVEEKERLQPMIKELHGKVIDPPGYDSLPDYKMDPDKRKELIEQRKAEYKIEIGHHTEENIDTLIYKISQEGKHVMSGFEIHQSDGSVVDFQQDSTNARFVSLTKSGVITNTQETHSLNINPNLVLTTAKISEITAMAWNNQAKDSILKLWEIRRRYQKSCLPPQAFMKH